MATPIVGDLVAGGVAIVGRLLDRLIPDPVEREKAKLLLESQQGEQALKEMQVQLSAILAEANSTDPWTSRSRPAFLYVVYIFILAALPMGVVYAFAPTTGALVAEGVQSWLAAIPEQLWWLFGAGYLGYTGARSFDKWRGVAK